MSFLYGNHITKGGGMRALLSWSAGLARISEGCEQYVGVIVFNMNNVPLGFGITAQTTDVIRDLDAAVGVWELGLKRRAFAFSISPMLESTCVMRRSWLEFCVFVRPIVRPFARSTHSFVRSFVYFLFTLKTVCFQKLERFRECLWVRFSLQAWVVSQKRCWKL